MQLTRRQLFRAALAGATCLVAAKLPPPENDPVTELWLNAARSADPRSDLIVVGNHVFQAYLEAWQCEAWRQRDWPNWLNAREQLRRIAPTSRALTRRQSQL